MTYIITGEDYVFFTKEKKKIQDAGHLAHEYMLDDAELFPSLVEQFCQDGFFENPKHLIIIKYLFDAIELETWKPVLDLLSSYGHSVIIYEHIQSKPIKDFAVLVGATLIEEKKPIIKEIQVSPFGFTDHFIKRDKKNAWISFTELADKGAQMGQISAALFWALKTLFIVKTSTQGDNPEIKPYTWNKMKRETSKWSEAQISEMLALVLSIASEEQFDEDAQRMKFEQMVFAI